MGRCRSGLNRENPAPPVPVKPQRPRPGSVAETCGCREPVIRLYAHFMPGHQLAELNVARLRAPLASPELAEFVALLRPVNVLADSTPGFVWRLQTEDGNATAVRFLDDDMLLVNMSVWESPEALAAFVYCGPHRDGMLRRREWFNRSAEPYLVLWWVEAGHVPTLAEAEERLLHLRTYGPTPHAFTFRSLHAAPDGTAAPHAAAEELWPCPAG